MITKAQVEKLTKKFMNALVDLCGKKYIPLFDADTGITGIFDLGRSRAPFYIIPQFDIEKWEREIVKARIAIHEYEMNLLNDI